MIYIEIHPMYGNPKGMFGCYMDIALISFGCYNNDNCVLQLVVFLDFMMVFVLVQQSIMSYGF